ncbi:hypothetical protein IPM19_01105 [bacterium]|nr:MAG: hypothetical protein IPM19_01105 [bacterium]
MNIGEYALLILILAIYAIPKAMMSAWIVLVIRDIAENFTQVFPRPDTLKGKFKELFGLAKGMYLPVFVTLLVGLSLYEYVHPFVVVVVAAGVIPVAVFWKKRREYIESMLNGSTTN